MKIKLINVTTYKYFGSEATVKFVLVINKNLIVRTFVLASILFQKIGIKIDPKNYPSKTINKHTSLQHQTKDREINFDTTTKNSKKSNQYNKKIGVGSMTTLKFGDTEEKKIVDRIIIMRKEVLGCVHDVAGLFFKDSKIVHLEEKSNGYLKYYFRSREGIQVGTR